MSAVSDVLRSLLETAVVEPIDVQLAEMFVRRAQMPEDQALAPALAAVFASRASRDGHSGISIAQVARQAHDVRLAGGDALPASVPWHDAQWWARSLGRSTLVSDGSTMTPLVVRDALLQFRRYYDAERRIAEHVLALASSPAVGGVRALSIITGGPGTGKTTLVAHRLVEFSVVAPDLRIALAAPTGKAAARLTESLRQRLHEVASETGTPAAITGEPRTLHRLLAYSPGSNTFRRNERDPLDDDLVIVDEASMVDVLMLDALLRALKPGARLMLVGDHHQLSSVDVGDALGAICRTALDAAPGTPLRESVTVLTRSWRFESQPGIGVLASAILAGDADAVMRAATNDATPEVRLRAPAHSTEALLEPIIPNLERCVAARSPDALLDALESFRVLAPERESRTGVHAINAAVERWLARRGQAVHDAWYHGRPVLVTANDYATRVYNGDVGVVWREKGQVAVFFRGADGISRAIAPVRLPTVDTAWAMTVHKSQGSEFDDVLVVVPDHDSRVMNRELLYTAVTRARRGVTVVGSEAAIREAVGRMNGRTSGLAARLVEGRAV